MYVFGDTLTLYMYHVLTSYAYYYMYVLASIC